MKVGTAPVNWGDDPMYTWVSLPPYQEMLDQMVEAGYEGTEYTPMLPSDPAVLRRELEQRGLQLVSNFAEVELRDRSTHAAELARMGERAKLLGEAGAGIVVVADASSPHRLGVAGRVTSDDLLSDAQWEALGEGLNRLGEVTLKHGVRLALHPHAGTYVETREEVDRALAATDPALVGLCPDTGHAAYGGADPVAIFDDYAARVWHVHLKDVNRELMAKLLGGSQGFVEAVREGIFPELGQGIVDIPACVQALRRVGYDGWVVVEQDAPLDPLRSAANNRRFLREACGI
jgi:inosose dehydratase